MHIQRRAGTYFWRRRLPQSLVPILGRSELTLSLRTGQRAEAMARARRVSVAADSFFERHKQRGPGATDGLLAACRETLSIARDSERTSPVPVAGSSSPRSLQAPATPVEMPKDPLKEGIALSVAVERYLDAKVRDGQWKPITRRCHAPKLSLFAETLADKPLAAVTRDDVRDWRDVLQDIDLSPNTIRLHFRIVSGLFNWANDEGLAVLENPTRRLAPKGKQAGRDVFKASELAQLFLSPLYTGHWRHDRRERPGQMLVKDHKFWFPLIALHSGMRAEEIAQLRGGDVTEQDGVPCFVIRASKTEAGQRVVPVHPVLIDLGLLDYRKTIDATSSLWPGLATDKEGRKASGFIKWWSGFRRLIGLGRDGLVFHSFRHTFVSALQRQDVAEDVAALLVGHQHGPITYGTYGGKMIDVGVMLGALSRLDFGVSPARLPKHR